MLTEAALAIMVCGDVQQGRSRDYWVQDCSAATENLLLAAHASGLGAVWMGVYPRQERVEQFARVMCVPSDVVPFSLIAIGHPAEHLPPSQRFDPRRVHRNHW